MELPRPLAPWGPWLAIFPRDLALSLGPVLQRLSFAVGPLRMERASGDGEPDGFDGLDRRGPYERLLASEWLLAEEAPEEFLRRAAGGEHTFLRLTRPVPAGSHLSVALFDAGPGQLGSPRIAQLAALIVLARRAEAAGVRFGWGILQEPDEPLLPAVTPASVLRLLQSRTPHEATDAQIAAWHERLEGWREADDAWIVGARRLGGLPMGRSASHLQVWDVLDPRVRRVGVTVIPGSLPPREIALDLPEEDACVRLLRDPFQAAAVAPPERPSIPLETGANPVFSGNGTKLFLRTRTGGVLAIPVPNSPRAETGKPRLYELGEGDGRALAAGLLDSSVVLFTAGDGAAVLHHLRGKKGGAHDRVLYSEVPEEKFHIEPGDRLRPLFAAGKSLCAVDARGGLFAFLDLGHTKSLVRLGTGVVTASGSRLVDQVVWAEAPAEGRPARVRLWGSGSPRTVLSLDGFEGGQAFFGNPGGPSLRPFDLLAIRRDDRCWAVFSPDGRRDLTPPPGDRVVGVAHVPRAEGPGLLVLDKDRRTLVLLGRSWSKTLPAASADVEHVAVSPSTRFVAWSTVAGEVVVYSPWKDAVLVRRLPEGEA
ncbi:MAG TPA: hypothetical protein VJ725_01330 [Thermoanaerobaculia bacterium]|nr:hypothetical protein [Thermoanaerobaculia bacterium]